MCKMSRYVQGRAVLFAVAELFVITQYGSMKILAPFHGALFHNRPISCNRAKAISA